ncbi:putative F-box protein [Corchorus capsularis]|uniref:Putative F-box protein n=1 Tax=Corchorus capsularis TaxID=210143 RepID=A0A1R3G703_COCAP|nr:putative F-box protein [Corchorus capsularis]
MAAVCRSWQASLKDQKPKFPVCLMILAERGDNDNRRSFLTTSEEKVMELELSKIRGRRCWGTPFGWLVTYRDNLTDFEIGLFNPLSRVYSSLPSGNKLIDLIDDSDYSGDHWTDKTQDLIQKLLLPSSPNSSEDCNIVMAIYSWKSSLAFAKPVKYIGQLFICQGLEGNSSPKAVEFANEPPQFRRNNSSKYLVELGGHLCTISRDVRSYRGDDLCMIRRDVRSYEHTSEDEDEDEEDECLYLTYEFRIVKLDMHTRNWENQRYDLYDNDVIGGGFDTIIYKFDNKKILRLPVAVRDDEQQPFRSKISPPLWIHPNS